MTTGIAPLTACLACKALAQRIIPELESQDEPRLGHDSSTNTLIRRYRKLKETS